MKVVFLDVDGVLNYYGCKEEIEGIYFVSPKKLKLLKQLISRTGAEIVLSSTWRYGWKLLHSGGAENPKQEQDIRLFLALQNKLKEYGLELMDHTPVFPDRLHARGEEISAWLEAKRGEGIESFVILDDMDGRQIRPYSARLVQTSCMKGLQQKHVERAVRILEKPWAGLSCGGW